jgi:hypothetical protein
VLSLSIMWQFRCGEGEKTHLLSSSDYIYYVKIYTWRPPQDRFSVLSGEFGLVLLQEACQEYFWGYLQGIAPVTLWKGLLNTRETYRSQTKFSNLGMPQKRGC